MLRLFCMTMLLALMAVPPAYATNAVSAVSPAAVPQSQQAPMPAAPEESVEEPDSPDLGDEEATPVPDKTAKEKTPAPVPMPPASVENGESGFNAVVLQGLNKVTARTQPIEAPIGSVVRYGTIEIVAHSCWKSAPEERPENAALLEISEVKQGEPPARIFLGWMFSSSPGLSSLEHPFYDITVVKCAKAKDEEPQPQPAKK